MDSEDELAAVVGHEMEHIDHYHCAERVQREQALHKIPFGALVALPIEVFEAGYSKDQELEADREGERLAVQAGYSANGAIRMFETFARLYEEYRARRARTPQEELSDVARQTLEGYFRSHPSPAERIEQVQKMIASESWPVRPERDLLIAYVFWTAQARTDFESGKYSRAQQLATRSLQVKPKQEKALEVLAKAQFAQADFAAAANSYRRLLELNPSKEDATREYALALAADRRSAAAEFQRWMDTLRGDKPQDLRVSAAGLDLLAGDATAARSAIALAKASPGEDWAPKWLADLAWWYYLAGDYPVALELATDAVQQRPSVNRFVTEQVWIQIENRRLADALENLNTRYTSTIVPDRTMARAVALWQARQQDTALSDFQIAIERQPQWENPLWIKAVYSPLVAQSIHEMQAERERRKVQVAGSR
jgi:predicted Zn-dependent protease